MFLLKVVFVGSLWVNPRNWGMRSMLYISRLPGEQIQCRPVPIYANLTRHKGPGKGSKLGRIA